MPSRRVKLSLVVIALSLIAGLVGITAYWAFVLQVVRVPTGAMANTIIPGDHLIVKKRFFGTIERGDIIVFRYPEDRTTSYIARVIGLPGESIHIRDTRILIDSSELQEQRVFVERHDFNTGLLKELWTEGNGPYRVFYHPRPDDESPPGETPYATTEPYTVPAEHYFMLGDNRDNSEDSRFRGPIARKEIVGKAETIYFSEGRQDASDEPEVRWNRIFERVK